MLLARTARLVFRLGLGLRCALWWRPLTHRHRRPVLWDPGAGPRDVFFWRGVVVGTRMYATNCVVLRTLCRGGGSGASDDDVTEMMSSGFETELLLLSGEGRTLAVLGGRVMTWRDNGQAPGSAKLTLP